jgi:predicted DNA-binding transcriptional regulator
MKKEKGFHLLDMLRCMQLGKSELQIYDSLTKEPMTIKDLKKSTKLSERMLRASIDVLVRKDFVKREIIDDRRLKYIYHANQPKNVFEFIKVKMGEMEKKRLHAREEIIKGMNYYGKKKK